MAISPITTHRTQDQEPVENLQPAQTAPTHTPSPKVGPATIVTLSNPSVAKADADGDGDGS